MILTPWSTVLPEKLTGPQIVKKPTAFYGTREFITAFTRARHLSLCQINTAHASPYHSLKIHFNSILPFTPKSSKRSLYLMFTHQYPVCTSTLPTCTTCPAHLMRTVDTRLSNHETERLKTAFSLLESVTRN